MKFPFSSFKLVNHSNELSTKERRNSLPLSFTHDMSHYEIDFGCDAALELTKWTFTILRKVSCRLLHHCESLHWIPPPAGQLTIARRFAQNTIGTACNRVGPFVAIWRVHSVKSAINARSSSTHLIVTFIQ
jgi:hypothetical protein